MAVGVTTAVALLVDDVLVLLLDVLVLLDFVVLVLFVEEDVLVDEVAFTEELDVRHCEYHSFE